MLDRSIQSTIYLYWKNYPEFRNIKKAVQFSQKIYFIKQYSKMIERFSKIESCKRECLHGKEI